MDEKMIERLAVSQPGIVTFQNWFMAPTGQSFCHAFCKKWLIVTDKAIGEVVKGFKSSEHWQLAGIDSKGNIAMLAPGCGVKNYLYCENPPKGITNLHIIE